MAGPKIADASVSPTPRPGPSGRQRFFLTIVVLSTLFAVYLSASVQTGDLGSTRTMNQIMAVVYTVTCVAFWLARCFASKVKLLPAILYVVHTAFELFALVASIVLACAFDPYFHELERQVQSARTSPPTNVDAATCPATNDGDCDDGGPGFEYSVCFCGNDVTDCGTRTAAECQQSYEVEVCVFWFGYSVTFGAAVLLLFKLIHAAAVLSTGKACASLRQPKDEDED